MKKIIAMLLAVMLIASLAACGGNTATTPATTEAKVEVPASALEILEKVWADYTRTFYSLLDNLKQTEVIDCHCGDEFEIDGIKFKILGEKNPDILGNGYNNSSMVIKMWDKHKSFIFLGDLGVEGGDKLLASEYAKDLECDYLQLAHHGNWAVKKNFYEKVKFRAALWSSPSWLYNNMGAQGFNTGHYESVIVRGWMEELGIKEHYVSCEGLSKIE